MMNTKHSSAEENYDQPHITKLNPSKCRRYKAFISYKIMKSVVAGIFDSNKLSSTKLSVQAEKHLQVLKRTNYI